MRKDLPFRAALALTALAVANAACNPEPTVAATETSTPHVDLVTPNPNATDKPTPFQPVIETPKPTPTETPLPTPTIPERFLLGSFDTANTPFILTSDKDLTDALRFIPRSGIFHADIPIPLMGEELLDTVAAPFLEAAKNNASGNPYFVFQTDLPNFIGMYFHSLQASSPGELPRLLGGFEYENRANPERANSILGKGVTVTTLDGQTISAKIVNVTTITASFFDGHEEISPWGYYDLGTPGVVSGVTFLRTDLLGIPDEIRLNKDHKTYYVIIFGCQNEFPGHVSLSYATNTKNRSFAVLKFTLP